MITITHYVATGPRSYKAVSTGSYSDNQLAIASYIADYTFNHNGGMYAGYDIKDSQGRTIRRKRKKFQDRG